MYAMFYGATAFNQDIGAWNVSSVIDMDYMFFEATAFNQDISEWCVTNIVSEPSEFSPNSPLSESNKPVWGTCPNTLTPITDANVQTAVDLWVSDPSAATTAYGAISTWDVSQVTDMSYLFKDKTYFNDDISNWDVSNVTNMSGMFDSSALSADNYDNILIGWSQQALQSDVQFGAANINYCNGAAARQSIIDTYGWTITDAGLDCATAGLEDENLLAISIYPNPTNNTLFITGNEIPIAVAIYNVLGKEVLSVKNTNNINVQALPSGVYMIRISDGVGQTNRKFIKN